MAADAKRLRTVLGGAVALRDGEPAVKCEILLPDAGRRVSELVEVVDDPSP